jgi:hypothetical protein
LRTLSSILFLACGASLAMAGTVCPAASGSNPFPHPPDPTATGCNVVITIAANGSVSTVITDATAYENSEDALVGVKNNSGSVVGSLSLTGTGVFGFELDGICIYTFVGSSYCSGTYFTSDPGDYAGPTTTFTNYSTGNSGTVVFNPPVAAGGGTTYFSLEGIPTASLTITVSSTPAPSTLMLLGIGLGCLAAWQLGSRAFAKS